MHLAGAADAVARRATGRRRLGGAVAVGIGLASVEEIDRLNILLVSMLAMARAVSQLVLEPDYVRVDGNRYPEISIPGEAVVRGDSLHAEISAASILAKQARDRELVALSEAYPHYGFERHKGYPTRDHIDALRQHGVSEHHRRSFAPVRDLLTAGVVS